MSNVKQGQDATSIFREIYDDVCGRSERDPGPTNTTEPGMTSQEVATPFVPLKKFAERLGLMKPSGVPRDSAYGLARELGARQIGRELQIPRSAVEAFEGRAGQ